MAPSRSLKCVDRTTTVCSRQEHARNCIRCKGGAHIDNVLAAVLLRTLHSRLRIVSRLLQNLIHRAGPRLHHNTQIPQTCALIYLPYEGDDNASPIQLPLILSIPVIAMTSTQCGHSHSHTTQFGKWQFLQNPGSLLQGSGISSDQTRLE